jgi:lysophospholipase L1-like esterase
VVFTSVGGDAVRVRFTNVFGARPLLIGRAAIGVEGDGPNVTPGTSTQLTFSGRQSIVLAPGASALSDPVRKTIPPLTDLAVSVYVPLATGPATGQAQAQQLSYVAVGDHALDPGGLAFASTTRYWYFVDGVDVQTESARLGTLVALGDSITDGVGSVTGANARWPNDLARRLSRSAAGMLSVVDEGIGGNRILSPSACCGEAATQRLSRDALSQPGVHEVILLEGINDIGMSGSTSPLTAPHPGVSVDKIIAGYEQLVARAHAAGLKIFGATLTPFEGSLHWTRAGEAKRDAVNHWILTSGAFDGVIDFAAAVADPADPLRLRPPYDSSDHLHPNGAGYRAMAAAIDLSMLTG